MAFDLSRQTEKAKKHIAEGEKHLAKWSLFSGLNKHEDAAECFKAAGNAYKVGRLWDEAAQTYVRAAGEFELAKSNVDASSSYVEAAKCQKNVSPADAAETYKKAILIYRDSGRFQQAGKMMKEVGEIYEGLGDYQDAVDHLQWAAEDLANENSESAANACLLKIAIMVSKDIKPPDLARAAQIFEDLGKSCLEKRLLQMNARGHWLQAGLCLLAQGDTVAARQKQEQFSAADHNFDDSREFRFLDQLIKAAEDLDVESFAQQCYEYDQMSKLDAWMTHMCLAIRRTIEAGAGVGEDDGQGEEEELDLR